MTHFILFDDNSHNQLLPLTYTRPVANIRVGILSIAEKWERFLNSTVSYLTQPYLQEAFPIYHSQAECVFVNGKICPNKELIELILKLEINTGIKKGDDLIAYKTNDSNAFNASLVSLENITEVNTDYIAINNVWDIFSKNAQAIQHDFDLLTTGKTSQPLSATNTLIGDSKLLFIEDGATVEASILNTKTGAIYIGKHAEVMEGSAIRGPFALCEQSTLKLNTKIYGATTIGPHCKVGGEINNSVVFGYSNKAHDGFLGNSVIGEWCNLGADTNNSNLKNNYANVKLFNYSTDKMEDTNLQFCGLIMGDHSKCGINTMFNTGTVVGLGANIFGAGFPDTHIPSFSWGGAEGMETYKLDKLFETAQRVYDRRGKVLNDTDKKILTHVFENTKKYRS